MGGPFTARAPPGDGQGSERAESAVRRVERALDEALRVVFVSATPGAAVAQLAPLLGHLPRSRTVALGGELVELAAADAEPADRLDRAALVVHVLTGRATVTDRAVADRARRALRGVVGGGVESADALGVARGRVFPIAPTALASAVAAELAGDALDAWLRAVRCAPGLRARRARSLGFARGVVLYALRRDAGLCARVEADLVARVVEIEGGAAPPDDRASPAGVARVRSVIDAARVGWFERWRHSEGRVAFARAVGLAEASRSLPRWPDPVDPAQVAAGFTVGFGRGVASWPEWRSRAERAAARVREVRTRPELDEREQFDAILHAGEVEDRTFVGARA